MQTNPYIIQARGLQKTYASEPVVKGIDLAIPTGGCFGLLGPNGAGKTTTLKMILGHSPITAGELQVLGQPLPGDSDMIRARIGVVPQTDNLDVDFTVAENLEVYAGFFNIDKHTARPRITELLQFVQLTDKADTKITQLSGGMQRRLSIARALVNNPVLLLLDEPTTGLDPQVRHLIWSRLRALKQTGTTLLLTTHYMEEAERLCDDLVIMDHGRILNQGSPRDLIRQHVEPDVVEIYGDIEQLEAIRFPDVDVRQEQIGETLYCFTTTPRPLLEQLENRHGLAYLHRPANLEDVFLRLTGRELREG
ncbi:MAG: ATP-binding cassette domain-containing protein [Gammaproteobacteria bacterium]